MRVTLMLAIIIAKRMRKNILIAYLLLIMGINSFSQEVGLINDPDGFTFIRSETSSNSEILSKILEGDHFLYFTDTSSNWWKVKYRNKTDMLISGYVHNSRIKPVYQTDNSAIKRLHEFDRTASSFRTTKRNISNSNL